MLGARREVEALRKRPVRTRIVSAQAGLSNTIRVRLRIEHTFGGVVHRIGPVQHAHSRRAEHAGRHACTA